MHTIVTGASSGIGESLVRELQKRGHKLTLVARRRALLEKLAAGHEKDTHVVEADLSDVDAATDWLAEAEERLGPVDVLINNAGVQIIRSVLETSWEDGERLLRLNTLAPLKLTHAVLPGMVERGSGCIVDISSMAALAPTPGMFFYNAAKGALGAASEGLRGELRGTGVHVLTVYPGPVRTPMETRGREALEENEASKLTPVGDPDELAWMIVRAIDLKKPRIIYPALYGLSRHFPNLTRWLLDRMTPRPKSLAP